MKAESQWPTGEDLRAALATTGSTRFRRIPALYCCLRCGDLRSSGVTEWRNGPLGLRNVDDDDLPHTYYSVSKCRQSADPHNTSTVNKSTRLSDRTKCNAVTCTINWIGSNCCSCLFIQRSKIYIYFYCCWIDRSTAHSIEPTPVFAPTTDTIVVNAHTRQKREVARAHNYSIWQLRWSYNSCKLKIRRLFSSISVYKCDMRFTIVVKERFVRRDGEIWLTTVATMACYTCKVKSSATFPWISVYKYSIQRCNSCKGNIWFSCSQIQHYNYATDKMR